MGRKNGGDNPQLDGAQRLLIDAMNTQMKIMIIIMKENNKELFEIIEQLENQMNNNEINQDEDKRHGRRRIKRKRRRDKYIYHRGDKIKGGDISQNNYFMYLDKPKKTRSNEIKCFKFLEKGHNFIMSTDCAI